MTKRFASFVAVAIAGLLLVPRARPQEKIGLFSSSLQEKQGENSALAKVPEAALHAKLTTPPQVPGSQVRFTEDSKKLLLQLRILDTLLLSVYDVAAGKELRFFRAPARKKWPLRGS